jgi:NADPH dehydrogenase (quinone)
MNVLIVNGHEYWATSPGQLNGTLVKTAKIFFQDLGHSIKETHIDNPYNIEEEIDKFLWANIIIYFTPVYWFDIPSGFKSYIEKVFSGGKTKLFVDDGRNSGGSYGTGGLMMNTKYMLITTWNAPEMAFNNAVSSFLFDNKSVDDLFLHFHSAQKFIGLKKMPGIHFYDVKKNPTIDLFTESLIKHLNFNFNFI